ncbi:TlpA disulfide reductase family protein [Novosphingobium sp. 9U]|uniref:TlpA family protein disulfide reductase n=1 Tax=Novosphingobium sp. 9U TaxID=2653158 RepID=UPI001F38261B|nr:TlpA disulfide reductase family protein [Novosphingobium sp. 9U]
MQPDQSPSELPKSEKLSGVLDRSHKGEAMPDLTLKDASGKTLALSSLRGQPTLVNLWATWCAPCVVELPTLDRLVDIKEGKLRVVTVSQDMSGTEKVAAFVKERGGDNLEGWIDPKGDLGAKYGVQTLPTTILYNSQGLEVWRFSGGKIWTNAEALQLVNEAK